MLKEQTSRIVISAIALVITILHLAFPSLGIDAITVGLLVVAILPWLSPIIKSIELPGVGKIELQEIKRQAQEAIGAANSASNKANFALASTSGNTLANSTVVNSPEVNWLNLVKEYNHIRENQKSGASRTAAMTSVIRKMIDLAPKLTDYNVVTELHDAANKGRRLGAYAYLYSKPDFSKLDDLVISVVKIDETPFGQYWGILTIGKVISNGSGQQISEGTLSLLRQLNQSLPRDTDRHYELSGILKGL